MTKTLGFADLTSVSGLYVRKYDRQEDGTFYNSATFAAAFLDPLYPSYQAQNDAIIGTLRSPVEFSTHSRQISQELRLASLPEDQARTGLQWVAGLYYADQWIHNTNFQQIPGHQPGVPEHLRLFHRRAGAVAGLPDLRHPGRDADVPQQHR